MRSRFNSARKPCSVDVDNNKVGGIDAGLLILLGVEQGDNEQKAKRRERIIHYRVFTDAEQNESKHRRQGLSDSGCSQFTLAADTRKGAVPVFERSSPSKQTLYQPFCDHIQSQGVHVETGQFGADASQFD